MIENKPKALFLAQTNMISGAETVLGDYLLNNSEIQVILYTNKLASIKGYFEDILGTEAIKTSFFMKSYLVKKNPLLIPIYILSLLINVFISIKLCKKNDITVIYGNNSTDVGTLFLIKLLFGKKYRVIAHCHDMLTIKTLPGIYLKLFSSFLDKILVPSKATKECLKELCKDKCEIQVVYNGLTNLEDYSNNNSPTLNNLNFTKRKKIIGFVGTISKRKRPDIFLDIISHLTLYRGDIHAVIVGKVTEKQVGKEIEDRISKEELPVTYCKEISRNDILSFYDGIDMLILSSDRDPLPTVILEAMSKGCLVFARDVDGVSEIIKNQKNGYLFSYNFEIEDIVSQINSILDNDSEKEKISRNAQETIFRDFSVNKKVIIVNNIIKEFF